MTKLITKLPIRAVLFDVDGTLMDTMEDMLDALNQVLVSVGKPLYTPEMIYPLVTQGSMAMIRSALGGFGEEELKKHQHLLLDLYHKNLPTKTALYPGLAQLLHHLEAHGLPWGVVTNRLERFTHPLLSKLGLFERARVVVCSDTYHVSKPHPLPISEAIKALGCSREECIYIGDAPTDIEAGQRAGIRSYIAAYGYCPKDLPFEHWGASGIITHSHQILENLIAEGLVNEGFVSV